MVRDTDFRGRDIISIRDFGRKEFEFIFDVAKVFEERPEKTRRLLKDKLVALLFFEPSTRTYSSFSIAAQRLGCRTVGFFDSATSSVSKGETLFDTIRMFEGYGASCVVMRHPKMGAARFVSEISEIPIVNAGDGSREHPTQAILDLYTIKKLFGKVDGLKIGLLGDLRYGRTASSLSYALANYDVDITFIAPEALQIRSEVKSYLAGKGMTTKDEASLVDSISSLDVLYVTRIQKERIPDPTEYERLRGLYQVDLGVLKKASTRLKILHPLPRVDEIAPAVDDTPFAQYFVQAASSVPVRAAILNLVMHE